MNHFHAEHGFTLIELLVTLSIALIMMTVAVPSFLDLIRNNRLTSQANEFVLALASAKSEAVKRGVRVTVCSRATNATCAASTTWDAGWLVFVDNDGGGTMNGADVVLQVRPPLEGGNTFRSAALNSVTFQNTGFANAAGNLRLCTGTNNDANHSRSIAVTLQGLVSSTRGASSCP
jgi:type IV fimbrial biogenesis protein FimT